MPKRFKEILVIDDEEMIAETLQDILSDAGYTVTIARTGTEGLEIALKQKFELIISDIKLPGLNGVEIFNRVSAVSKVPMILMTGYSEIMDMKEAYRIGVNEFVAKPFTAEDILSAVNLCEYEASGSPNLSQTVDQNYCRIFIDEFVTGSRSPCDVYLKLSANKYVKVAKKESPMSKDRTLSFQRKGLDFFYVTKGDFNQYVGTSFNLSKVVNSSKTVSKRQKLSLLKHSMEACLQDSFLNGLNPLSFEMSKGLVESAMNLVMDDDEMFLLLDSLQSHSDRIYSHSVMVSLYSVLIVCRWGWRAPGALFTVAMCGLYHDIGKKEIPAAILAKDRTLMTADEIAVYETHPQRGRDILMALPGVGEEVVQVAYQHHENLAGTGYPQHLARLRLHPLAKVVGTANRFCDLVFPMRKEMTMSAQEALTHLYKFSKSEIDLAALKALMEAFSVEMPLEVQRVSFSNK